jgi:hypothetical protein
MSFVTRSGPVQIQRKNRQRIITVNGEPEGTFPRRSPPSGRLSVTVPQNFGAV